MNVTKLKWNIGFRTPRGYVCLGQERICHLFDLGGGETSFYFFFISIFASTYLYLWSSPCHPKNAITGPNYIEGGCVLSFPPNKRKVHGYRMFINFSMHDYFRIRSYWTVVYYHCSIPSSRRMGQSS